MTINAYKCRKRKRENNCVEKYERKTKKEKNFCLIIKFNNIGSINHQRISYLLIIGSIRVKYKPTNPSPIILRNVIIDSVNSSCVNYHRDKLSIVINYFIW